MENKKYIIGKKFYKIAKILYILLTIFLLITFFYVIFFSNQKENDNYNGEVLTYIIVFLIIIGIPGNSIITLIDLISVILISIYKTSNNKEERKSLINSIILLILPALTIGALWLSCLLIVN